MPRVCPCCAVGTRGAAPPGAVPLSGHRACPPPALGLSVGKWGERCSRTAGGWACGRACMRRASCCWCVSPQAEACCPHLLLVTRPMIQLCRASVSPLPQRAATQQTPIRYLVLFVRIQKAAPSSHCADSWWGRGRVGSGSWQSTATPGLLVTAVRGVGSPASLSPGHVSWWRVWSPHLCERGLCFTVEPPWLLPGGPDLGALRPSTDGRCGLYPESKFADRLVVD